jgi:hypothetical protein
LQAKLDFTSLVFVDETGATTSMVKTHGWGQKGKKLIGKTPHGHWMTSTSIAGPTHDAILAPLLVPCPMTCDPALKNISIDVDFKQTDGEQQLANCAYQTHADLQGYNHGCVAYHAQSHFHQYRR